WTHPTWTPAIWTPATLRRPRTPRTRPSPSGSGCSPAPGSSTSTAGGARSRCTPPPGTARGSSAWPARPGRPSTSGPPRSGAAPLDRPAAPLAGLLAPGGRLVLQQPAGRPATHRRRRSLATGYPFPDAAGPRPLGALVDELDGAGLEVRGVTVLREHHARTLRAWATRLQRHWTECAELAGPGRARVWLLHLAASALACDNGRIGRYEIRAKRTNSGGGGHHFAPAGPAVTAR